MLNEALILFHFPRQAIPFELLVNVECSEYTSLSEIAHSLK